MQVPSIERPAISGRPWKRMNWRAMAVRGILGAMALMVATVVGHVGAGDSVADVAKEYGVSADDVLAAIAYAAEVVAGEEVRAI